MTLQEETVLFLLLAFMHGVPAGLDLGSEKPCSRPGFLLPFMVKKMSRQGKMLIKYLQSFNTLILVHKLIGKCYKAIYRRSVGTFRTETVADTFLTRHLDQTFSPHKNSPKKILLWSPKCVWGIWRTVKWGSLCRVTELLCDRQDNLQSVSGVCALLCCLVSIALIICCITCYIICYVTYCITVYITYVIYLMLCCF